MPSPIITLSVDDIFEYILYATACISDSAQNIVFQGIAYKLEECSNVSRDDLRRSMAKVDMALEESDSENNDSKNTCSYCNKYVEFNQHSTTHICEECINVALNTYL